jgi:hypothetical protein
MLALKKELDKLVAHDIKKNDVSVNNALRIDDVMSKTINKHVGTTCNTPP